MTQVPIEEWVQLSLDPCHSVGGVSWWCGGWGGPRGTAHASSGSGRTPLENTCGRRREEKRDEGEEGGGGGKRREWEGEDGRKEEGRGGRGGPEMRY